MRLPIGMVHVFFYALPRRERFIHQGLVFVKINSTEARNMKNVFGFESHYGCVISKDRSIVLSLVKKDFRPLKGGSR